MEAINLEILINALKGQGLPSVATLAKGEICTSPVAARALFAQCPAAAVTPLHHLPDLASRTNVAEIYIKDERERMGLGSFKSLGAAFAIAKAAEKVLIDHPDTAVNSALSGRVFACASAGNHGLSMAAGAAVFGAKAVVFLAETVPAEFAARLKAKGATVVREGENYEASMAAAKSAATKNEWQLLSDSSWVDYTEMPRDVMEGYLIMGAEVATQLPASPTHIFLQAGVGGLAAASAAAARYYWGAKPKIFVVEPAFAPALFASINAKQAVATQGPVSAMGRLDCKEPSHLALKYLAREADGFITISEAEAQKAVELLDAAGLPASPSAVAGFAGFLEAGPARDDLGLNSSSRVLFYLSEGPVDA